MKSTLLEDELTEKPPDKKITLQEDNLTLPVHVQRGFLEKTMLLANLWPDFLLEKQPRSSFKTTVL